MSTGLRRLAVLCLVAFGLLSVLVGPAQAADDASIDHAEHSNGQLKLLVSVPGDAVVDLGSVSVTIDGKKVDATAENASSNSDIQRTTVLAIDTSDSMNGARIDAAKAAASTYLDTVPANVAVGLVTFDNDVVVRQPPTLDHNAVRTVLGGLTLKHNTALYQGVQAAITATGTAGQRQVLVLSDGKDNTKAPLQPVIDAIKAAKIKVDVVALDQGAAAPQPLADMASASGGQVISANSDALAAAFNSEAAALVRQILVTATVPKTQRATEGTVAVSLDSGDATHTASAFIEVASKQDLSGDPFAAKPAASSNLQIPQAAMYGALAAIAVGVIGLVAALAGGGKADDRPTIDQQLQLYSASEEGARVSRAKIKQQSSVSITDQAKQAAEKALASNAGIEARIAGRLEGAGMALKSSEWLLLHLGIAFAAGIFGLLLSGGSPIAAVLFLLFGLIGPWVFLGLKRSRRLKAFDSSLPDTLQLMSGSLSAGLSLAQSLDTIVREGQEPMTSEFKRVIVESRLGVGLEDALEGVAARMQSVDFKWVVMAIRIQREVGGNLAELLNNVAGTLREREFLRRHVRALSAEGRLSAWILGGLPPAFLAYLTLTKPDYVHPMYTTPVGWVMLSGMAVLLTIGIFWMVKVAKVEV
ncbi:type II secretion system F family protein [Nocardioides pocheonensis]|uniref:VWA domain-containing protein n=1 Tax=Nocardioides pocheonensis TaxID=661485 RepID=A0A3N0GNR7_9ACTN|nr:type II secretion system F family protein [Nocardioides pocheonensis]RNM14125.1 VWA domain-containing protein [Nocardioides pocheonensis]